MILKHLGTMRDNTDRIVRRRMVWV